MIWRPALSGLRAWWWKFISFWHGQAKSSTKYFVIYIIFQKPLEINCNELAFYGTQFPFANSEVHETKNNSLEILRPANENLTFAITSVNDAGLTSETVEITFLTPELGKFYTIIIMWVNNHTFIKMIKNRRLFTLNFTCASHKQKQHNYKLYKK